MCCDEETDKHLKFGVVRFLIKTKYSLNLNETFNIEINRRIYRVKLVEYLHGPKRIVVPKMAREVNESEEFDSDGEDGVWDTSDDEEEVRLGMENIKVARNLIMMVDFPVMWENVIQHKMSRTRCTWVNVWDWEWLILVD